MKRYTGADIRTIRTSLNLTQEEFARALNLTVGTINRWENNFCQPSRIACTLISQFVRKHQRKDK